MTTTGSESLREQLARALDWEEAHVGFTTAIEGIPPDKRGAHAAGFEHSPWQLLEHVRITLRDLVDFATNPRYADTKRQQDYWPTIATPSNQEWDESIAAVRDDLGRLQALTRDASIDLSTLVPTGKKTQTYLRTILLAIDHNAYHVGQIVAVRRALNAWP